MDEKRSARALLNYAKDLSGAGRWSNDDDGQIDQAWVSTPVDVVDARSLPQRLSLDLEGIELAELALADPQWAQPDWVNREYLPRCVEMVLGLTGAAHAVPYTGVIVRTQDRDRPLGSAPPARFVHIDQTRASATPFIDRNAGRAVRERYRTTTIHNVWRAISPAPHNTPLAVCDQHSVDESTLTAGVTVTAKRPEGVPYVTSVYSAQHRWFYFSDLSPDETIVFKGVELDEQQPLGCLHSAFDHPEPIDDAPPRVSVEARVLTFFD